MDNCISSSIITAVITAVITSMIVSILFMENSTYNGTLIERDILQYHPVTGQLGWVDVLEKNNVEIYEGDILYTHKNNGLGGMTTKVGKVVYKAPMYGVGQLFNNEEFFMDFNIFEEVEIIGNIYENKEKDDE